MQVKSMDWRSEHELEEERLALKYHSNSNVNPQLEVLTRSRMKMLNQLFAQRNVEVKPAKRYFSSPSVGLRKGELAEHPFMMKLLVHLQELQVQSRPFLDYEPLRELGGAKLDGPELYIFSRSPVSGRHELFYCNPAEMVVQRVKETDPGIWNRLFHSDQIQGTAEAAVFVTAKIQSSMKLFGERGYRLSLLEGGRLTERLSQCTHKFGWKFQPVATFYDRAVQELLEIDGHSEVVLSCLILEEVK
ncbi:hypothetical protein NSS79_33150 [Paenibacillus sp. FSL L8-0436]|uniref:hypothetical protein n=1 Tax=Paenibacillus sp. FSL L8-0436 TaxID=2954686 RepID=UPI00315918AE